VVAVGGLDFRSARHSDADAVAALHADSWRRHYRGAFSDAFLDADVVADRLVVWTERLADPDGHSETIVAEDRAVGIVGFVHTIFEADPQWGALLDNLHVVYGEKRRGVGTRLLAASAREALSFRS
jgi:hypothetical protein